MPGPIIAQNVDVAVDVHGLVQLRLLNGEGAKLAVLIMASEASRKVAATLNHAADRAAQVAATPMTEVH